MRAYLQSMSWAVFLLSTTGVNASPSPCGATVACPDWEKIATQQYDEASPLVTIWEHEGNRVICSEPGPAACAGYGGDLAQFKADAGAETAKRKEWREQSAARRAEAVAAARKARHCNPLCGEDLLADGWKEVARCHDGHSWRYVLEQGDQRVVCEGINARGGPTEGSCHPYKGDTSEFKPCTPLMWQRTIKMQH